jgi:ABC-type histidine transport system ATPase subunit
MVMIEVDFECECNIVSQSIRNTYNEMCDDKLSRNLFSLNESENKKQVKKFRKALKMVYEHYNIDKLD